MRQHHLVRLVHALLMIGGCVAVANPTSAQGRPSPTPPAPCVVARSSMLDSPKEITFWTRSDLQGIYDMVSQTPSGGDPDDVYATVHVAPDWTFADLTGTKQNWVEKRARDRSDRLASPWDSRIQRIRSLTILPDGVSTVVSVQTRRNIVDTEGRYGRKGECRTVVSEERFLDKWIKVADRWKMASREQTRASKVAVVKRW